MKLNWEMSGKDFLAEVPEKGLEFRLENRRNGWFKVIAVRGGVEHDKGVDRIDEAKKRAQRLSDMCDGLRAPNPLVSLDDFDPKRYQ